MQKLAKDFKECPIAPGIYVNPEGEIYDKEDDVYVKLEPFMITEKGLPKVKYLRYGKEITFSICVLVMATFQPSSSPIRAERIGYKDENKRNYAVSNLFYKK